MKSVYGCRANPKIPMNCESVFSGNFLANKGNGLGTYVLTVLHYTHWKAIYHCFSTCESEAN